MMRYLAVGGWVVPMLVSVLDAQEQDFAAALGTPGLVWTAPESGGRKASVAAAADAQGGSLVVIPAGYEIHVPVAEERFVKVRFRKSNAQVTVDGTGTTRRPYTVPPENVGTQWMTYTYVMPKPGVLQIGNYGGEIEVDTVTFLEPSGTVAEAVGMPGGVVMTGGAAEWVLAPFPESDQYGAKVRLTEEEPSGWMDVPVTGPAEVRVNHATKNMGTLRLLSGGKVRWDSAADDAYGNAVVLELPAGEHVVRLEAGFSRRSTGLSRSGEVSIGGIVVSPLGAGKVLAAMDDDQPWARSGGWEVNDGLVHDGPGSLSPAGAGYARTVYLRRSFTGPAKVSFWSYMEPVPPDSITLQWSANVRSTEGRSSSSYGSVPGWRETSFWVPPGEHHLRWEAWGKPEQFGHMAIDGFKVEPTEEVGVAQAVGVPQLSWTADGDAPWRGVMKEDKAVVVSPILATGSSSKVSAKVNGPGVLSFRWDKAGRRDVQGDFRINGTSKRTIWSTGTEVVETVVSTDGEVELSWHSEGSDWASWIELSEMTWTALPEVPLAEALDAQGVVWTTSAGKPSKGRPHPGALNGSAAQVGLPPGGEAWLEATVEGSGLFDFWLLDVPGSPNQSLQLEWDLYVDGVKAARYGAPTSWPATWVLGDGVHHLRLHFRNPWTTGEEKFIAVDRTSWEPMASAEPPQGWSGDSTGPLVYFPEGGRDGEARFVLPTSSERTRWIERSFTGPGVVTWDSTAEYTYSYAGNLRVIIDGRCEVPVEEWHPWQKHRLYLPAGEHTVRWSVTPSEYRAEDALDTFDSVWQISGVSFVPGVPDLMKGADEEGLVWLATGDESGMLHAREDAVGGDVWILAEGARLQLCNTGTDGLRAQGRMDALREVSEPSDWETYSHWLPPGGIADWDYRPVYGFGTGGGPAWMDGVTAERVALTSVAEGLDLSSTSVESAGWEGILSATGSYDGVDCAWARVDSYYGPHTITTTLPAASRVKFRWKKTGSGGLGVRLDGAWLPLAPPGGEWSEMEFETGGAATVEWALVGTGNSSPASPGDGWVDGVEITPLPEKTLAEVLAPGGEFGFSQTVGVANANLWKPVAYPAGDGTWRTGARVVSSASELATTVTGPVHLSFRVWCGPQAIPVPAQVVPESFSSTPAAVGSMVGASSIVVISPGGQVTERFLTVTVDGKVVRQINRDSAGGWTEHQVLVPPGQHQVSWQLGHTWDWSSGYGLPEWQAVLSPITRISPRQHYDAWAEQTFEEGDPTGTDEDADGDGVPNFREYAYGTDPRDASSVPARITGGIVAPRVFGPTGGSGQDYELRVPRLLSLAQGTLEESADLIHWTPSSMRLRNEPIYAGSIPVLTGGDDSDAGIYQVMRFRVPSPESTGAARFYRVKLMLPE